MARVRRDVLDPSELRILKLQAPFARSRRFFLAGGTALALRLGHRTSRDLDWFSAEGFDPTGLAEEIARLQEQPSSIQPGGAHTLRAYYGALETSFIRYTQVSNPEIDEIAVDGVPVPIATIELIAIMKVGAVINRGSKRDFVDVYAIGSQPGWSIAKFIDLTSRSLPVPSQEIARAMTYFDDAERDPMPERCTFKWPAIKSFISSGVKDWQRQQP
jgi:hypothetical protein